MKKYLFIAATAALALSSCSSDETLVQDDALKGEVAVSFDTYMTREGRSTWLTYTDYLKTAGFGVYGYDHGILSVEDYTASEITPNFFNNQPIKCPAPGTDWTYGNVKYWPNGEGAKLSFFAYAPYSAAITTDVTSNPRLILNGNNHGPALYYQLPTDLSEVLDLCWGAEDGKEIAPVNKMKPAINTNIKFNFKHAFARYGFNIEVFNDEKTDGTGHNNLTNKNIKQGTTIKINSVKLIGNFANEGVLRLYDGKWNAQIANTAVYEFKSQFNTVIADGITYDEAKNEIPLFDDATTYFMMIPGGTFRIQIDYDVITEDPLLPGGHSKTNNVITSEKTYTAVEGVATDFHLNLGMTTVKFDAEVTTWNSTANIEEVDLPNNTKN